jgi:hypothetical protein
MKSILSSIFCFLLFNFWAQNSGIRIEKVTESGVAINGQTIDVTGATNTVYTSLNVVNLTNDTADYYWERVYCGAPTNFLAEQLCDLNWCFELPVSNAQWISDSPATLAPQANSLFEPKVVFRASPCDSALLCYYVLDAAQNRIDSIKINFYYLNPDICPELVSLNSNLLENIEIYPNPSNGQIHVKNAPDGSTIEITDMLGKVVLAKNLNSSVESINLSNQPDGVYFYTIKSADGVSSSTKRIVLRR